ncbi:carbon-nitrogen hydrolase family protein, partial [Pseudoalteromonas ruthenica]|uniref:carbon-nitrogen hydrolase family protein n=1 Tax=Pseudoalteromonas ruthenica TaxID=151081 RepID=UPI00110BE749
QGIRLGVVICFDLWFPEIVREYVSQEVDILLHPANFGGEQSFHIARARAIENGLYVVTCNRIGEENIRGINGYYCGKSQVI